MGLEIYACTVSAIGTNCYLIRDEETGECAVIDPGEYSDCLVDRLEKHGFTKLKYILLTHGHFDHIDGVSELKAVYGGDVVISEIDEAAFTDPEISLHDKHYSRAIYPTKADITVKDGDVLDLGNLKFSVIATPGHTEGSVCYKFSDVIFTGDTLFKGSCGRTDFKSGDSMKMQQSLNKLAGLGGDFLILSGHGFKSTLEYERMTNPYISL